MDVGFYLGELLTQRGEVKVPGLGNFSQIRMSAYYDENEAIFYPPYNKVHFEPQADIEDDALADYLVAKKRISVSSAKYFIEKYINNLRLQAIVADVPLGNMGYFYTDRAELSFKPVEKLIEDSEVYGYTPVKISKTNNVITPQQQPEPESTSSLQNVKEEELEIGADIVPIAEENIEPIAEETPAPVVEEKFENPVSSTNDEAFSNAAEEKIEDPISSTYDEAFLDLPEEEEEEHRGPLRGILITLAIIALLAIGVFALYRYAPATFDKLQFWKTDQQAAPAETRPNIILIPELDSTNTDSIETTFNDTARVAATDTITKAKPRFALITGKGFKNLWAANEAVKKYRAMGLLKATLAEDTPGNLIKVSIDTFNSISESEAMRQKLIKEEKLNSGSYTLEIINQ